MSDKNRKPTIHTEAAPGRASHRYLPFGPLKVTATAEAAAEIAFEAGGVEISRIGSLILANTSGAAVAASLHISSDEASDTNMALGPMQIPANSFIQLEDALMLAPGHKLMIHAGSSGAIRVSGWATVYL